MHTKKLMPMDDESRRLINWIDKGVSDALCRKYLETLNFCIFEKDGGPLIEDYCFSFTYTSNNKVEVKLSQTGVNKITALFYSSTAKVSRDQIRSSECKMIRTLVSLMRTLEQMPNERVVLMKLLYYEAVTPLDYEPPLFECINIHEDESIIATGLKFGYMFCASSRKERFYLDSGASYSVCGVKSCLQQLKKLKEEDQVSLWDIRGVKCQATHKGTLMHGNIVLSNVLYAKSMFSTISIGELDSLGLMISISGGRFTIFDVENSKLVGEGVRTKDQDYEFTSLNWMSETSPAPADALDQNQRTNKDGPLIYDPELWIIDSCSAVHLTSQLSLFVDVKDETSKYHTPNGSITTTKMGDISSENIMLKKVHYSATCKANLLSVFQLESKGFSFTFYKGICTIQIRKSSEVKGIGVLCRDTFHYHLQEFKECEVAAKVAVKKRKIS